ncbi:MAG: hypothetical protein NTY37_11275 [Methanothrix sp.]|nr:hypothetical protein [Methanothrix sp.]
MKFNLTIAACLVSVIIFLALPLSSALGVNGATLVASVTLGETIHHEMLVSLGKSDAPMDLVVDLTGMNQTLSGTYLSVKKDDDVGSYSARSFLNVSPTSFHLDPGGSQKVILVGIVPEKIGDGGRYALVTFKSAPLGNKSVGVLAEIQVPVALTVSGSKLVKTGDITSLKVDEPTLAKEQNLTLIFKNTGNIHYKTVAEAVLKDKDGKILANATSRSGSSINPSSSRLAKFELIPSSVLKPGVYEVSAQVKLEDSTVLATKEVEFEIKQ